MYLHHFIFFYNTCYFIFSILGEVPTLFIFIISHQLESSTYCRFKSIKNSFVEQNSINNSNNHIFTVFLKQKLYSVILKSTIFSQY